MIVLRITGGNDAFRAMPSVIYMPRGASYRQGEG